MAYILFLLSVVAFGMGLFFAILAIPSLLQKEYTKMKHQLMKMATAAVASFALFIVFGAVLVNEEPIGNPQEVVVDAEQPTTDEAKEEEKARILAEKEKAAEEEARVQAEEQRKQEEAVAKKKAEEEAIKAAEEKKVEDHLTKLGLVVATIASVVDGDTVTLSDGNKVRLIGVNTPESTTKTEEYGAEASAYTKKALEGKTVYLQKDVSETDRYGRLLRLVWIDIPSDTMNELEMRTKLFNAKLVLDGYAEPSTYNPDVTYSEYFKSFAREARESSTGLWAIASEGTTKGDFDTVAPVTNATNNATTNSGGSTNTSSSTESYSNCTALKAVHPGGVGQDHPAYESKHDRDNDGWACESDSSAGSSPNSSNSSNVTSTPPATTQESFKNCTAMRAVYPNGVGQDHPAYANKHDRDKDGWACE